MAEQEQIVTPKPRKIFKEFTYFEIGAIVVFLGFMIYLAYSTKPILNFNNTNETIVVNNIPIPSGQTLYPSNSFVPKSSISNSQLFFEIFLFVALVIILLGKRATISRRATPKEAMDDISKQLKQLTNIALAD